MGTQRKAIIVLAALAVLATSCWSGGGDAAEPPDGPRTPVTGGTLRVALLSDVTAAFDPHKEYYEVAWELFRCCLLRTLLSYEVGDGRRDGRLRPDLAAEEPKVSNDGLTWTFRLQRGLRFGPPFEDREIVADDIIRALERAGDRRASRGGYAEYYSVIRGFDAYRAGRAERIDGLTAVDSHSLRVDLEEPTPDLGHRFALPATAPLPAEAATDHVTDYGRFLVSSGPYMFHGSEGLDFSQDADDQDPVAGYSPGSGFVLVRNPSWVRETDPLRQAYVDRIEARVMGRLEDVVRAVEAGDVDVALDGGVTSSQVKRYRSRERLRSRLFTTPPEDVRYLSFNLAVPPFDDVQVRKAISFAIDKRSLRDLAGGPLGASIAGHLVPDRLVPGLADYDPYATEGHRGDLDRAREELRKSAYDEDGDGRCDLSACERIQAVATNAGTYPEQAEVIRQAFRGLGMDLDISLVDAGSMWDRCNDPDAGVPVCLTLGWSRDYRDALTVVAPLFSGGHIGPARCCNHSLVGAPDRVLERYGYDARGLPNVDERIAECAGRDDGRAACWGEVDRYLMEEVVPAVPYLFERQVGVVSGRVTHHRVDAWTGLLALDHVALRPESDA